MKKCVTEEWSTGSNTFYGSGKTRMEYGTIGFRNMELTLTRTVIGEMGKTNWNEFKKEKERFENNQFAKTSAIYLVDDFAIQAELSRNYHPLLPIAEVVQG